MDLEGSNGCHPIQKLMSVQAFPYHLEKNALLGAILRKGQPNPGLRAATGWFHLRAPSMRGRHSNKKCPGLGSWVQISKRHLEHYVLNSSGPYLAARNQMSLNFSGLKLQACWDCSPSHYNFTKGLLEPSNIDMNVIPLFTSDRGHMSSGGHFSSFFFFCFIFFFSFSWSFLLYECEYFYIFSFVLFLFLFLSLCSSPSSQSLCNVSLSFNLAFNLFFSSNFPLLIPF